MKKTIIYLQTGFLLLVMLSACGSKNSSQSITQSADTDTMVLIKGGVFTMGTNDQKSFENEGPAHTVRVDDFYMDVHEVTNGEYEQFVKATGYKTIAERELN